MIREKGEQDWKTVREKIKNKFGKLSDAQINELKDGMEQLPKIVKSAYNYDQAKTDQECKAFKETLKKSK